MLEKLHQVEHIIHTRRIGPSARRPPLPAVHQTVTFLFYLVYPRRPKDSDPLTAAGCLNERS